jgi:hypothetical protein
MGNQLRSLASTYSSSRPSANGGALSVTIDPTAEARSTTPDRRMPEMTPAGTATARPMISAKTMISRVSPRREAISWPTGLPDWIEVPKFPCSAPVTQIQYWVRKESLRWYAAVISATACGLTGRVPSRFLATLPGSAYSRLKTTSDMTTRSAIIPPMR